MKAREKGTRTTNQLKSEHALSPKGNQIEYGGEQFCNWTCFPSHIKATYQPAKKKKMCPSVTKKKTSIGLCSPNDWSKEAVLFRHHDHGVGASTFHPIVEPIIVRSIYKLYFFS